MPTVIQGAPSSIELYRGKPVQYEYPMNMDLNPNSQLHARIIQSVMDAARASYSIMSDRHSTWRDIDKTTTAYITLSDYEKVLKQKNPNKPVSIVVPHSFATLETILAYQVKAFLSLGPIFTYNGFSREDMVGAKLLELVVDQQVRRFKSTLSIYAGFRNGLAYGLSPSHVRWDQKYGKRPVIKDASVYSGMGALIKERKVIENEPVLLFEGNKVENIDPYKFLPDPNVSPHNIQDGEFVGWIDEDSYYNLLSEEAQGNLFNVKYLEGAQYTRIISEFAGEDARNKGSANIKDSTGGTRLVTLIHMYKTIIPDELGVPAGEPGNDGSRPEKWYFLIANDTVCLFAGPLNLNHNMYPIAINAPDFDGFSVAPVSRLEMNSGMQSVINWLFNSHIQNVRKAINDMFIVDPSLINMNDLENPEPGKLLRLRRAAWGRGVEGAISQLKVSDVTRMNIGDAVSVMDMMNRSSAAVDSLQGIMRTGGERRSATEFTGTHSSAISRLESLSYVTSQMYMADLAYLFASHTQQLMTKDVYVRAIGEWPQVLAEEYGLQQGDPYLTSIYDILADFDIEYRDGSSISEEQLSREFWTNAFTLLMQNQELNQVFDITRIFMKTARLHGAKDVNQFVRKGGSVQAKMLGDQAVLDEAAKGNLVPMTGKMPAMPGVPLIPDMGMVTPPSAGGSEGA